jgi:membrane-associated HD superfamily phosphohydrolase
LLVLTFLASLVAIFISRDARRRSRVVRAAGAGGLTVAAFAALIGIADRTPVETLIRQMVAGLGTGLITGIAVVGLLPVLESLSSGPPTSRSLNSPTTITRCSAACSSKRPAPITIR